MTKENTDTILEISLEKEMRKSYLDYAMSVIVGRALPDARDGLKPVHRRVLFAMKEMLKARVVAKRSVHSVINEKKFLS